MEAKNSFCVWLVEDDPVYVEMADRALKRAQQKYQGLRLPVKLTDWKSKEAREQMLDRMESEMKLQPPDIVLLDLTLVPVETDRGEPISGAVVWSRIVELAHKMGNRSPVCIVWTSDPYTNTQPLQRFVDDMEAAGEVVTRNKGIMQLVETLEQLCNTMIQERGGV